MSELSDLPSEFILFNDQVFTVSIDGKINEIELKEKITQDRVTQILGTPWLFPLYNGFVFSYKFVNKHKIAICDFAEMKLDIKDISIIDPPPIVDGTFVYADKYYEISDDKIDTIQLDDENYKVISANIKENNSDISNLLDVYPAE